MTWKNTYEEEEEKLAKEAAATFDAEKSAGFDDSAYQTRKPVYTSSYADRIDDLVSSLESRPEFRYDAESDPLYQPYRSQYRREGSRAVDDTLAEAAAYAGGMNSYAVTAAQQAGDYYNAQLMDRVPELAQLAYEMYRADYDADVEQLNLLRAQEAAEYSRYQDQLADWYTELENAYRQYRDSVGDSQWQQSFDYEKAQDKQAYRQWLEQFNYNKAQDAIDNAYRQSVLDAERSPGGAYTGGQTAALPSVTAPEEDAEDTNDLYTGTDYYQDAINAAVRGDRAAAEAALDKRAAKMADSAYGGTGGGTSMEAARQYIESLLAYSEDADISRSAAAKLLSKSEWKEQRASGTGIEASYATYEDYVSDYLRYLTREG